MAQLTTLTTSCLNRGLSSPVPPSNVGPGDLVDLVYRDPLPHPHNPVNAQVYGMLSKDPDEPLGQEAQRNLTGMQDPTETAETVRR